MQNETQLKYYLWLNLKQMNDKLWLKTLLKSNSLQI